MKIISALVTLFLTLPLWFYLLHWILVTLHAGELQMFLFWVYVPFGLFASILARMAGEET